MSHHSSFCPSWNTQSPSLAARTVDVFALPVKCFLYLIFSHPFQHGFMHKALFVAVERLLIGCQWGL